MSDEPDKTVEPGDTAEDAAASPEPSGDTAAQPQAGSEAQGTRVSPEDSADSAAEPDQPSAEAEEELPEAAAEADDGDGEGDDEPEAAADDDDADDDEEAEAAAAAPARTAPARSRRRGDRDPSLPAPVVRAEARYVRSSARKARLVCNQFRGRSVEDARAILAVTPRAIASDWSKLLESAVANAEHNHELVGEDLYVKAVHADEGPTIKRFQPRAKGRATRIRKRTSHLTILLTPKD